MRHYTVDPLLPPSGNPFKCHEEVLSLQPMIRPKRFDIFPPDGGMLRRSRCVQIFFKHYIGHQVKHLNIYRNKRSSSLKIDFRSKFMPKYSLFCFIFFFVLSLKPRPFVQSFFDLHAPRQPRGVAQQTVCVVDVAFFPSIFVPLIAVFSRHEEYVVRFFLNHGLDF